MKTKSIIYSIILLAFFGQSCEKFLEEDLVSDVSAASYYTTPAGFEDAVDATYAWLKYSYGPPERGFTSTVFGTDIFTNGADGSHKVWNWYDNNFNSGQPLLRELWRDWYKGINQANAVINRSTEIEGLDPALIEQRLAEVRFLRAFYYFNLVQHWGDVHLTLEETEGIEIEANRTPASEIYSTAIIPDLENAISLLPAEQNDYGRVTKPAAEFMLAKVLLTRSYKPYAEANDAARAEALMTSVIDNYGFELLEVYGDLWDQDNQLNTEVIWAVQNTPDLILNGTEGNRGHLYFLFEYDIRPGMQRDTENGRPWKRFRPTPYLLSLWNRDIDSRYDQSFKHVWYSNNANSIPIWTQEDVNNGYTTAANLGQPKFEVGDTALYIPGPGLDELWTAEREGRAGYTVYTSNEYDERVFPSLSKFLDPRRPDRQWERGSRDFVVARLADAYLIRAEARLMQNEIPGAVEDINVVRRRAAWPGEEDAMEISAADVDIDFILDERARELAGEMQRWFDLVRTGKLVERVRLYNAEARDNIQEYHVLRPIPLDQIDRTQGGYEQNPGYPVAGED